MRRPFLLGALVAFTLALPACGDQERGATDVTTEQEVTVPEPGRLPASGVRVIERARDRVSSYCRAVAALPPGRRPAPSHPAYRRAVAGLQALAGLARRAPAAETADGVSARLALGDIAEDLEGTNCDPRLVAWIGRVLIGLP